MERPRRSNKVSDYKVFDWEIRPTESVKYSEIINYERAGARGEHHCVMCGLIKGSQCEIPNQNKDVCKTCDSAYWCLENSNIIVKFCKGCKKFSPLCEFVDKPEASKCAKCRHRGRQNYYSRKNSDGAGQGSEKLPTKKQQQPPPAARKATTSQIAQVVPIASAGASAATASVDDAIVKFPAPKRTSPHHMEGAFRRHVGLHSTVSGAANIRHPGTTESLSQSIDSVESSSSKNSNPRSSLTSESSRSSISYSARSTNSNQSVGSEDDAFFRSMMQQRLGADPTPPLHLHHGNTSTDFPLMVSPGLNSSGQSQNHSLSVPIAMGANSSFNVSDASLNATAVQFSPHSAPAPQQTPATWTLPEDVTAPPCPPTHTSMTTPGQLPLFEPSPMAPQSTSSNHYPPIDAGLTCDITPLSSLSSPGNLEDDEDSPWQWDPSMNSLMNLAALSECVLSSGSSSPRPGPSPFSPGMRKSTSSSKSRSGSRAGNTSQSQGHISPRSASGDFVSIVPRPHSAPKEVDMQTSSNGHSTKKRKRRSSTKPSPSDMCDPCGHTDTESGGQTGSRVVEWRTRVRSRRVEKGAEDNILHVAIVDAKRLRALSPEAPTPQSPGVH
mmetsp:Transcript_9524/g.14329  ORF Transcript_9524/g.14329 Transcript_9524/m.14329 type:complete len:610 (+) Transcript_9524:49-1878(+)